MQKRFLLCALSALLVVASAAGADTGSAETTVKKMVDQVLSALDQEGRTTDEKLDTVIEIITPVFDFPLMAKLTLGRTYWPKLSEDQQQEFTDLFVEKLRKVYMKQADNFSRQQVVFEDARQVGSKVHLASYVQSKGDRTTSLYKLYKSGDVWKIYDLEIQDVSMIRLYKAQFVPIIRDQSPAALLQELRESLNDEKTE